MAQATVSGRLARARKKLGLPAAPERTGEDELTSAQLLYLSAFERWLRDPSETNTDERAFWLRGLFYEARVTPPWEALGPPRARLRLAA